MTSAPVEPGSGSGDGADDGVDAPAGDLGVGGPAEQAGEGGALTPPGYPEEVDPARGPRGARPGGRSGGGLGDLEDPGADRVDPADRIDRE